MRQFCLAIATAVLLGAISGCGNSKVGLVSGVVTYEGAPVGGLEVEFNPVGEGRSSIGFTNASGEYVLQYTLREKGALIGPHKVRVSIPPGADLGFRIPPKYGHQSELTCDVVRGRNEFDIAITKDG